MRIVLDIDGVLCELTNDHENYHMAKQHINMINLINDLYDNGHEIIIYTARGMGSCNGSIAKVYSKWYSKTEKQLKLWGLKYHELYLGKPYGDIYVDDKAFKVNQDGSSVDNLKKFLKELDNG